MLCWEKPGKRRPILDGPSARCSHRPTQDLPLQNTERVHHASCNGGWKPGPCPNPSEDPIRPVPKGSASSAESFVRWRARRAGPSPALPPPTSKLGCARHTSPATLDRTEYPLFRSEGHNAWPDAERPPAPYRRAGNLPWRRRQAQHNPLCTLYGEPVGRLRELQTPLTHPETTAISTLPRPLELGYGIDPRSKASTRRKPLRARSPSHFDTDTVPARRS